MTVPPGTMADEILRLRGKGLVKFGGYGRGDMNLRLALRVPEHLSKEEKRLYEELRTAKHEDCGAATWRRRS